MFDFLFEGDLGVYLLLALVAAGILGLWWYRRQRGYLLALGIVGVLVLLVYLLDIMVETDTEQAKRTLAEVTAALNDNQFDRAFDYLSDDFKAYDMNAREIRPLFERAFKRYAIRNIRTKSIEAGKRDRDRRELTLRFNATVDSNIDVNWSMAPCEVDFGFDKQGRCRIRSFRIYEPIRSESLLNPFQM